MEQQYAMRCAGRFRTTGWSAVLLSDLISYLKKSLCTSPENPITPDLREPLAFMPLVEDRSQTAESNADHCCQQGSKEGIPGEGPGEEEGCRVQQKKHFRASLERIMREGWLLMPEKKRESSHLCRGDSIP